MTSNAPDDARKDASPTDATTDWDPHDESTDFGGRTEAPLWRRLHPDYRPHEHYHPEDDPWDDAKRIDGIIAQTHADLDGHPIEQVRQALTERFRDSNLRVTADAIQVVAEDIASETATPWSARTLEGAFERQRQMSEPEAEAAAEEVVEEAEAADAAAEAAAPDDQS